MSYQIVQVDFCGYNFFLIFPNNDFWGWFVHPCETDTYCFHFSAIMISKPVRNGSGCVKHVRGEKVQAKKLARKQSILFKPCYCCFMNLRIFVGKF